MATPWKRTSWPSLWMGKMRKKLIGLLQAAMGVGIIVFILARLRSQGKLVELHAALQAAAGNWPLLLIAVAGFGLCLFFVITRWFKLLQAQGVEISFGRATALYLIGQFFNAFLFGATGGDVVKAYYAAVSTPRKKTEVVATVFIDRLIGMIALIFLAVAVMLVRLPFFLRFPQMRLALWFNLGLLAATCAGLLVIFRRNLLENWAWFRRLEQKTAIGRIVARSYEAFHLCLASPGVVLWTLVVSVASHMTLIACIMYAGMALNLPLGYVDYLTVFLIINAIAAIPITPGGLGTREMASIYILATLGVDKGSALALSLFIYAGMLIWSLLGGVVYLGYAWTQGRAPKAVQS